MKEMKKFKRRNRVNIHDLASARRSNEIGIVAGAFDADDT